jgi:hypothetical protein
MKTILRTNFEALARVEGPCVSLYLPLTPTGRQGLGDSVRLKKALDQAEEQLLSRGCSLGPGTQQCLPLTIEVAEEAWCDKYLHIRPLLPMVVETDRFYLLAISQNHVHMYEGSSDELLPLQLKELPQNLEGGRAASRSGRSRNSDASV